MIGTCSICLEPLDEETESFVETCLHHFCFDCIVHWTQLQLSSGKSPTCPLCKRGYSAIIYDCHDVAFRRWNTDGSTEPGTVADGLALTAAHRRRRMIYTELGDVRCFNAPYPNNTVKLHRINSPEVQSFVRRELQAILLVEDTWMLEQHCIGTLKLCIENELAKHRDFHAASMLETLQSSMLPYLECQDLCQLFASQVIDFVTSGLNVAAYDELHPADEKVTFPDPSSSERNTNDSITHR